MQSERRDFMPGPVGEVGGRGAPDRSYGSPEVPAVLAVASGPIVIVAPLRACDDCEPS